MQQTRDWWLCPTAQPPNNLEQKKEMQSRAGRENYKGLGFRKQWITRAGAVDILITLYSSHYNQSSVKFMRTQT
jgi:hypothetical protein